MPICSSFHMSISQSVQNLQNQSKSISHQRKSISQFPPKKINIPFPTNQIKSKKSPKKINKKIMSQDRPSNGLTQSLSRPKPVNPALSRLFYTCASFSCHNGLILQGFRQFICISFCTKYHYRLPVIDLAARSEYTSVE